MIVGLTGGIASGKTFCTDYLAQQFSVQIIDADIIAREVIAPHTEGLNDIVRTFGVGVLNEDGGLNRAYMRQLMLSDHTVRQKLNAIIHPRVRNIMLQRIKDVPQSHPYQIMSVPLLLENGLQQYSNVVVVIDVDEATQLLRLQQRDHADIQAAQRMIDIQIPRTQRLSHANFIIDNSGSKANTQQQLDQLHHQLLQLKDTLLKQISKHTV